MLAFDYFAASFVGGPVDFDIPVQLSRINLIMQSGLSFTDPYFGMNGVLDVRYSANVMSGLYAIGATMLRVSAVDIWAYSYGFFRLLIWISFFGFCWEIIKDKLVQRPAAYAMLSVAPLFLAPYLTYAQLPDRLALAWIALFLTGYTLMLSRKTITPFLLGTFLIATTHTLYALIVAGFIVMTTFTLLLVRRFERSFVKPTLIALIMSAVLVLANALLPNRIGGSDLTFNAAPTGTAFAAQHYGPLFIGKLPDISWGPVLLFAGLLVIAMVLQSRVMRLRHLWILLCLVGALAVYDARAASLLVVIWLIVQTPQLRLKILLTCLGLFYGVIAYNPFFVSLTQNTVPPWVIGRVGDFNILGLMSIVLAPIVIVRLTSSGQFFKRFEAALPIIAGMVLLIVCTRVGALQHQTVLAYRADYYNQRSRDELNQLSAIRNVVSGQVVFSDDRDTKIRLPNVTTVNVTDIRPTNASPGSNFVQRLACSQRLERQLGEADLVAAKVTRVVVNQDRSAESFKQLVTTKPYLRQIARTSHYVVYEVTSSHVVQSDSVCSLLYKD